MMSPESPVSPVAQAPPDRPTLPLERIFQTAEALMYRDGGIDQEEMRIVREFMIRFVQQVQLRRQMGQAGPGPQASPMQMNAEGAEDLGSGQGEPMEEY